MNRDPHGALPSLLVLALISPTIACSGSEEWANSIKSFEVGEDRGSAAPGCDATPLQQLTAARNDQLP